MKKERQSELQKQRRKKERVSAVVLAVIFTGGMIYIAMGNPDPITLTFTVVILLFMSVMAFSEEDVNNGRPWQVGKEGKD